MTPILRQVAFFAITLTLAINAVFPPQPAWAETGYDAWLRYAPIDDKAALSRYDKLPNAVFAIGDSPILQAAREELVRGVHGMLGRKVATAQKLPADGAIVIGTFDKVKSTLPSIGEPPKLADDGYWLKAVTKEDKSYWVIAAPNDRGVLYGTFALLRMIALNQPIEGVDVKSEPYAPIRFLNHWDNCDGTIERGYAGKSVFWDHGHVTNDLGRVRDYARLMASLGINGCSINNVNADPHVVGTLLPEVVKIAEVFRPWGVRLLVSLDFGSPRKIGNVDTFDPLDPGAVKFWQEKVDEVYRAVPDLAGFVLKADSEGRLGPSEYGRTHADAANVIARALKPHGGIIFYRGFVYNNHLDWNDPKADRAGAAYENFHKLDGKFDDNVIVQIKHGPIDFQVREPASPLFGGLEKTNQAIELQITQEYLGQQRHLCYIVPMWKATLDFDMHVRGDAPTPVKDLVAGKTFNRPLGGFVGVSNVGRDANWLGHHLAMANLYGFGRLAWNPNLSSQAIAEEWTKQTFGGDKLVVDAIVDMLCRSWSVYENYSGPLGALTMTNLQGPHYGPGVETSERNGWGHWHRADEHGMGMDRTAATGTGYVNQYAPPIAAMYESLDTCPDELLLFMHHVPYTHVLHSGKTLIQHIYDSHYQGAQDAEGLVDEWKSLKGHIDDQRYQEVLQRLTYQAGHAAVWRDAFCQWFLQRSGIPDASGRAGHYPTRIEAEAMQLDGYEPQDIKPWETASGGKCAACNSPEGHGSLGFKYQGPPGKFDLKWMYFDQRDGASRFKLNVADRTVDQWVADDRLADNRLNGDTATRHTAAAIELHTGDEIRLEGTVDGEDHACVDYVEIVPATE
jgi:alpha-glucuronidase